VTVERTLETETERVEIPLPAVVCVTSDAAVPRIPGMKEILAAGKRLVIDHDLGGLGVTAVPTVDIVATTVPPPADRGHQIFDVANDGDVDRFAAALAAALQ